MRPVSPGSTCARRCAPPVPAPFDQQVSDLLERDFTAAGPNTRYVGGITFLSAEGPVPVPDHGHRPVLAPSGGEAHRRSHTPRVGGGRVGGGPGRARVPGRGCVPLRPRRPGRPGGRPSPGSTGTTPVGGTQPTAIPARWSTGREQPAWGSLPDHQVSTLMGNARRHNEIRLPC